MTGRHTLGETEARVANRLSHMTLDFEAMAVMSNLFRAASAVRNHFERNVLAESGLSWTAFVVPFLFVLSPPLLLQGPLIDIVIAVPLAILGVFFVSAALSGCIFRNLSTLERLVFGVAGITIMLPQNLAAWAIWANLLGLAICLPLALRQWALRRSASAATI